MLKETDVDDTAIANLADHSWSKLSELNLAGTKITGSALDYLHRNSDNGDRFAALTKLNVSGTGVSAEAIRELQEKRRDLEITFSPSLAK